MDAVESRISEEVSTKQRRIAENAKNLPTVSFSSLAYHMDKNWLFEAYRLTRKDGAVGVDEVSAEEYALNLSTNLGELLELAKSGRYKAPPVRRGYVPKPGSTEKRPIGVPTFEDKVLQRAIHMLLEPIYENDFYDFSYGFRRRRSAHQALEALWKELMGIGGGWVIDLDIRKFFDTLDHGKLREILAKRMCDGVVKRLIGKWLNAGVMEKGEVSYGEMGTPQGGVISPLLSNIYLHEVLDDWFVKDVKPRLRGRAFLIRYADDAVLGFSSKEDAERVMAVLPKRFGKYGLTVHPEKTKLLDVRKPADSDGKADGGNGPASFGFLGFTHYWGKSRKGSWIIKRKTDKKRLARALVSITLWCRKNLHKRMTIQRKILSQKLRGHYAYYGVTGNHFSLARFFDEVKRIWFKWLNRRSRIRSLDWAKFSAFLNRFPLPSLVVVHSVYAAKP